jgi:hypothetical protein
VNKTPIFVQSLHFCLFELVVASATEVERQIRYPILVQNCEKGMDTREGLHWSILVSAGSSRQLLEELLMAPRVGRDSKPCTPRTADPVCREPAHQEIVVRALYFHGASKASIVTTHVRMCLHRNKVKRPHPPTKACIDAYKLLIVLI